MLKTVVKLMLLGLIAALVLAMASALFSRSDPQKIEPLRVKVDRLAAGGMQGIEWNRRRLLIIRTNEGGDYLVVADYDSIYGCPLRWVPAGAAESPHQPWTGGLRAVCIGHWYDAKGVSLTQGVDDLQRLPFVIEKPDTLVINATK